VTKRATYPGSCLLRSCPTKQEGYRSTLAKFSVAGAAFDGETRPTATFLDDLIDHLNSGKRSCFRLGHDEDEFTGFRLVLVVQRMSDGETAEQVGAYGLQASKPVEEDLWPLD
jgi:hypothetical protein